MKQYKQIKILISFFDKDDVVCASRPDGDNNLPFVPVEFSS